MKFIKFGFPKSRKEVEYHRSTMILIASRWSPFETVMQDILRRREKNGAGSGGEMRLPMSPPPHISSLSSLQHPTISIALIKPT
jgi:hypothetical protein